MSSARENQARKRWNDRPSAPLQVKINATALAALDKILYDQGASECNLVSNSGFI